jgi:hypothetical protein
MPTAATVRREIRELRRQLDELKATAESPLLGELAADPALILAKAGMAPDPWQEQLLRSRCSRVLLNCGRQIGKSQTAAALALKAALLEPGSLVLLLSPSLRQSSELFRDKVKRLYQQLGRPIATKQESALTIEFVNGSRIISLPGDESTIRGYSGVSLLVIDEASRVLDDLYRSVRPMLAVSGGSLIALSTPWGRRGWWFEAWHSEEAFLRRTGTTTMACGWLEFPLARRTSKAMCDRQPPPASAHHPTGSRERDAGPLLQMRALARTSTRGQFFFWTTQHDRA